MNVRFFAGTRAQYKRLEKHNPIALYFCADSRELFWGDKLISDGARVVKTKLDLPDSATVAEGVIYFVLDTKEGYVFDGASSEWVQVIYAPVKQELPKDYITEADLAEKGYATEAFVLTKVLEILENQQHDCDHGPTVDLSGYATKDDIKDFANISYVDEKVAEITVDLTGYATESWVESKNYLTEHQDISGKADREHAHDNYAEKEHEHSQYLTEHQSLAGYAKKEDLFNKDYNELVNKPAIPSIAGLATEAYVDEAVKNVKVDTSGLATLTQLATKADNVPFVEDAYISKPIGSFILGESIKGLTVAEILAKLLGLSDTPVLPDLPAEPEGIVDNILINSLPMYAITADGILAEIPYNYLPFTETEAAEVPTASGFYQVKDASGGVIESGYQEIQTDSEDTYYVIALPNGITFGDNLRVQAYSNVFNKWMDDDLTMTCDAAEVARICGEAEVDISHIDTETYTVWALEESPTGRLLRFIINE